MSLISRLKTSIGSKLVMAITGLLLLGFVVAHLAGNLLVFAGREAMNDYAEFLKNQGPLLWVARVGLLAVFALHIANGVLLARANREARPVRYVHESTVQADLPSRTMIRSGLIVLLYVIYHLAHFTFGVTNPEHYALVDEVTGEAARHDVFGMLVRGFQNPLIAAVYLAANFVLAAHLSHGIRSAIQTFGWNHPAYNPAVRTAGPALAWLIFAGFASIPTAVLLGIVSFGSTQS